MNKIKLYIQDSINELFHKVSWPTRSELQSSAIVVLIASLIISLVIFFMDVIFQGAVNFFYKLFE